MSDSQKCIIKFAIFMFLITVLCSIAEVQSGSIFDTFGGTQTLPFRAGEIQVPLSINPEQTPTFKSGTVEWVDFFHQDKETTTSKKAEKKDVRKGVTEEEYLALPQLYIVKENDSLSEITERFYGEVSKGTFYKEAQKAYLEAKAERVKVIEAEKAGVGKEGADTSAKERPEVQEYTIEEGDVLYISVWQEDDLSGEVVVRPDGRVSFPLAGDVPASGLTFTQLKEELTKRLKEYIKYPVVSISLRKLGGKKVIVLGEVTHPGVYSVTGESTMLEAIALAGGFTPHAVSSSVILVRGGFQTPEGTRLDLSRAMKKTDIGQNVALQSEDIVYVPKKFVANVNYFLSQILDPISKGVWTIRVGQD